MGKYFESVSFGTAYLPNFPVHPGLFVILPNFYGLFFHYFYGVPVDFPRRNREKGKFSNTRTAAASSA